MTVGVHFVRLAMRMANSHKMHTYRQIIYLELIPICFQYHSLICLDFSMNNLYFIIFKREKKLSYPQVVVVVGFEVVQEEVGEDLEVLVDFDHNNHLILDCSHQCNLLTFDCSNHSLLIGSRNSQGQNVWGKLSRGNLSYNLT